jgi:multiple sugar transport system ATP-binding protein
LADASGADRRLTARVSLLEALGSEIVVHFSIDAKTVDPGDPDAAEVAPRDGQANSVGRFNPRSRVRSGEVAEIAVSTENLHFFDLQTRLNLRAAEGTPPPSPATQTPG